MLRLGFLVSHGGTSMKKIIEESAAGRLDAVAQVVISNNSQSPALAYARSLQIPAYHLSQVTTKTEEALDQAICDKLQKHGVTHVVLSGYMKKIGPKMLVQYHNRILNVHPALLPKFGGQGMYGNRVHEAVIAAGELETGATIHLVDPEYDHGRVLGQRTVAVLPGDTPESLSERVKAVEPSFFVEILQRIATGEITL